jgi:hypothetical protein
MAYGIKKKGKTLYCPAVVLTVETKNVKGEDMVVALFEQIKTIVQEALEDYPEINFNYLDVEHDEFPKHWEPFAPKITGTWE